MQEDHYKQIRSYKVTAKLTPHQLCVFVCVFIACLWILQSYCNEFTTVILGYTHYIGDSFCKKQLCFHAHHNA